MVVDPSNQAENQGFPLLIVGASARAAAMSASRAGIPFAALDLFADHDLRELPFACGVRQVPTLDVVADFHHQLPLGPWMYTGGLENRPALVDRISRERELFGNSSSVLRQVRNPTRLRQVLLDAGIPYPDIRADDEPPSIGKWLWKPHHSCGGRHIHFLRAGNVVHGKHGYLQEWIPGTSWSAIYVASAMHCHFVGTTQQILQRDLATRGRYSFRYAGSILGPEDGEPTAQPPPEQWRQIGIALWQAFGLVGVFGVDTVIRMPGGDAPEIVPIEVNPRYTASVELLEYALGFRAVASHISACRGKDVSIGDRVGRAKWYGKSVLFASRDVRIGTSFLDRVNQLNAQSTGFPAVADIPLPGATIRKGQPVATVMASADTREELLRNIGWQGIDGLLHHVRSALKLEIAIERDQ